ncbi:MAG: hypothetical protein HYS05_05385 [Acidobacteria bacterium]|nr:hypothetical protein [Acidobacteriota bacterium]
MSWISLVVLGGIGGALNAISGQHVRLLPSIRRLIPGKTPIVELGLLGNIAIGAVAAVVTWWRPGGPGCVDIAAGADGFLLASGGQFLIAFATARWMSAERDRAILRRAVCKAATAPAAHPDTVRAIEAASPEAVYEVVDKLIPRHVEH